MPVRDYPFQVSPDIPIPSPVLPIKIINPDNGKSYKTWGLIDTGAFQTAIPGYIAQAIGHNIDSVKPTDGCGADGILSIYKHSCSIEIFKMDSRGIVDTKTIIYKISRRRIGVIKGLPFVLLGVKEFLKKFVLTVDYPQQQFSIKKPERGKIETKSK